MFTPLWTRAFAWITFADFYFTQPMSENLPDCKVRIVTGVVLLGAALFTVVVAAARVTRGLFVTGLVAATVVT